MSIVLEYCNRFEGPQARAIFGPVSGTLYVVNALGQVDVTDADAAYLIAQGWAPTVPGSGPNYTVVDFGAFPGSNFATTTIPDAVPGAPADGGGLILTQVVPVATADHSADEHAVDGPTVSTQPDGSGNLVINAYPNSNVPNVDLMKPWGKWTVAWNYMQ